MSQGRQPQSPEQETLARTRRIETRVTQIAMALGVATQAQKPEFNPVTSSVRVPSVHSSLRELLDSIPKEWKKPVRLYIGGDDLFVEVRRTATD